MTVRVVDPAGQSMSATYSGGVAPSGDPSIEPLLVGRDAEVDVAVRHVRDVGQALVSGVAGVGKSTFLDAVARRLADDGFAIFRLAGTAALMDHPLAALGHLIGDPADRTGPALASFATARLLELARGSGAVLVVDDAHVLDPWSLHVIGRARADGGPRVLLAARGGSSLPEPAAVFGRHPGVTIQLHQLSRSETAVLAAVTVGLPLDTPSAARIHEATDGLPLAVVELLRHAQRRGALVERHGLLRWDATVAPDRQLAALLGLRVDDLDPVDRDVVDAVAIVGELPIGLVRRLAPRSDLARLEAQRLIRASPRTGWVVTGHPLLRDAAISLLAPVRRQALLGRLALLLTDETDPELERLGVVLAVEAEAPVTPSALMAAVRWGRSLGLWKLMAPVMERAWKDCPGPITGLAHGEALYWARRMVEADDVFAAAISLCTTDGERVALTTARARTLEIGLGRSGEAAALRERELAVVEAASDRLEVLCAQAERWLFDGEVVRILDVLRWASGVMAPDDADGSFGAARYRLTQSTVGALGLHGRIADMVDEYEVQRELSMRHAGAHPLVREVTDPWWAASHLLAGNLAAVEPMLAERYASALLLDDGLSRPLWALPRAIERWLAGDLVAAEHFAREAMGVPAEVTSIRRMATHFLARVLERAGRPGEALPYAIATAGDDYVGVVRAWSAGLEFGCRVHLGELVTRAGRDAALHRAQAALDDAVAVGQLVPAAFIAHDLVRAGAAEHVIATLESLVERTDVPTVRWMHGHALGLVDGDPRAVVEAADGARAAGCHGLAVLLADDAVAMAARRKDGDVAARAADVARRSGADVTGIARRVAGGLADRFGLSEREQEVARAAAAGLTDQEIADGFYISVRTVNAHLRSVYRKLGVTSRRELRLFVWTESE